MNVEEKEVAQQLAAHPNFRWVTGMVEEFCDVFVGIEATLPVFASIDSDSYYSLGKLPDISHSATKGCLLALARELWGVRGQTTEWCDGDGQEDPEMWAWQRCDNRMLLVAPTEGIALARAIMEAPARGSSRD